MANKWWWLEKNLVSVVLLLSLVICVPSILVILVPSGLLTSDAGTNLATEIFGIIVTIFVIDRLLHWDENRLWKKVKNQVYDRLGEEIYYIIVDLIYYVDLPSGLVTFGVGSGETMREALRRNFFKKIDFLCKADLISMNDLFKKIILKGGFGEIYAKRQEYLSDIEAKYFRFLTPEILIPLMNIQRRLHSIDLRIRGRQKSIKRGWIILETEEEFCKMISLIVLKLFKDVCRLKDNNVKIYFD